MKDSELYKTKKPPDYSEGFEASSGFEPLLTVLQTAS